MLLAAHVKHSVGWHAKLNEDSQTFEMLCFMLFKLSGVIEFHGPTKIMQLAIHYKCVFMKYKAEQK